jgi:hypothetical protein
MKQADHFECKDETWRGQIMINEGDGHAVYWDNNALLAKRWELADRPQRIRMQ